MKGPKMTIQVTFNEKEMQELVSLLTRTQMFSKNVIEIYKFDGSNDSIIAPMAFDASGHLYQSSGVLLSLLKDMGVVLDDK